MFFIRGEGVSYCGLLVFAVSRLRLPWFGWQPLAVVGVAMVAATVGGSDWLAPVVMVGRLTIGREKWYYKKSN